MTRSVDHTVRLIKALTTYDRWTRKELIVATGWHRDALDRIVGQLHNEKVIHIDGWADDILGRQSIAIYALGPGKDKPKRTALSGKARQAAYLARKKQQAQVLAQQVILGIKEIA